MTDTMPTAPESTVERALVARGWADIDLAERLGSGASRRHRVATLTGDRDRARAWYRSPVADHVPATRVSMYESEGNIVRYRRVIDFLTEGERVYEVGLGYGYLGVLMLREGRLARYRGVDLEEGFVRRTRTMLEVNGLAGRAEVAQQNLYDLTRADLEEFGAGLLVCCEVIEHVPDAEEALAVLARALPEGTDLLFSIPLVGRLESVWGHTQIFGAARIQAMIAGAGLVAHHVEALHDTWALVLASTTPEPSPRAAAALEAVAPVGTEHLLAPEFRTMTNEPVASLPRAPSRRTAGVAETLVEAGDKDALRVTARPQSVGHGRAPSAGVAFGVPPGTKGVRLELDVPDLDSVDVLGVEFREDGQRCGLATWTPAERRPTSRYPTFLLAPGRKGMNMRRSPGSRYQGADTVEVYATAIGDAPIDFSIRRWSWVS